MSDDVHEAYIRQLLEAHQVPQVTIAWQGGEPTLMGLDFFKRSVELQKKHRKPGTRIENTFQTNGILLDDAWCRFFHENNFLIGLSMDGPRELHDFYRKTREGRNLRPGLRGGASSPGPPGGIQHPVHRELEKRRSAPGRLPVLPGRAGAHYIQFIPIVERDNETGCQEGDRVTDRSVRPEPWGAS